MLQQHIFLRSNEAHNTPHAQQTTSPRSLTNNLTAQWPLGATEQKIPIPKNRFYLTLFRSHKKKDVGVRRAEAAALDSGELSLNLAPDRQGAVLGQVFDGGAVGPEASVSPHLLVLLPVPLGEAPLLGDVDLEWNDKRSELMKIRMNNQRSKKIAKVH